MPFEVKLMHINPPPLNIQISRFSVFCLAHFWSRFQEKLRYLHFYTSHLRGEGRHGVNGHLVVRDGDMARGGHVEGAGFCKETRVLHSYHFSIIVRTRAAIEPLAEFS